MIFSRPLPSLILILAPLSSLSAAVEYLHREAQMHWAPWLHWHHAFLPFDGDVLHELACWCEWCIVWIYYVGSLSWLCQSHWQDIKEANLMIRYDDDFTKPEVVLIGAAMTCSRAVCSYILGPMPGTHLASPWYSAAFNKWQPWLCRFWSGSEHFREGHRPQWNSRPAGKLCENDVSIHLDLVQHVRLARIIQQIYCINSKLRT